MWCLRAHRHPPHYTHSRNSSCRRGNRFAAFLHTCHRPGFGFCPRCIPLDLCKHSISPRRSLHKFWFGYHSFHRRPSQPSRYYTPPRWALYTPVPTRGPMRIHWCRFLSGFPFRSFRRKPEERIRFLQGYRLPDPRTVLTSMAPTYRSPGNRGILRIHHRGHMLWCLRSPCLQGYTHPLRCNPSPPMVPRNMSRYRHAL